MALLEDLIYVALLIGLILFGKVSFRICELFKSQSIQYWNTFSTFSSQLFRKIRLCHGHGEVDTLLKYLSSTAGFCVVLIVSGRYIIHPIFSVLLQICLLRFVPTRMVHWVSFAAGFAHLFHFRLCWDLPFLPSLGCPPSHTNCIQMIMTLKVCNVMKPLI